MYLCHLTESLVGIYIALHLRCVDAQLCMHLQPDKQTQVQEHPGRLPGSGSRPEIGRRPPTLIQGAMGLRVSRLSEPPTRMDTSIVDLNGLWPPKVWGQS